jgi:hypothetical protein
VVRPQAYGLIFYKGNPLHISALASFLALIATIIIAFNQPRNPDNNKRSMRGPEVAPQSPPATLAEGSSSKRLDTSVQRRLE